MKKYRILYILLLSLTLFFTATQVFASSVNMPNAQGTPSNTRTPRPENDDDKEDQAKGKHEHYKGTVAAADSASITLILKDGSSVTIGLTGDTRIKFAGPKRYALTSIAVGMTANVQALRDQNDNLVARMVLIKPSKPSKVHRVGIVTEYTPDQSITIQAKDGNTYTFTITSEIKLLPPERGGELAVGSRVTIIAPRDPATGGVIVKGIVIHPAKP
jgi:hypothetical protein